MVNQKLIHGEALQEMAKLESGSIDLILTDPPYGTTACSWDSIIDFDKMWVQLNRIIKPNGVIALFGSEPFSTHLRISNIKHYKYDWIWVKANPSTFVHAKNMPMKKHELISCFCLGSMGHKSTLSNRMEYNPQGLYKKTTIVKNAKGKFKNVYGRRESHKDTLTSEFAGYPNSLLNFGHDNNRQHPTQKPVSLLEYLVKTYTNENETVLDFTMGSGSTLVACQNTNRNGIGIELDDNYFKRAAERVNEAIDQTSLFNRENIRI